jgi:hypothetical protein
MKYTHPLILVIGLFLLCACTVLNAKQSTPAPVVLPPKPLVLPVGKNWQIIEEAPKLSDERGHLPFQTEQSVQPEGVKPVSPAENRKIETPL